MSLHPPGFIEPCLPTGSQTVPTVRNEGVPWLKAKSLAASASFPDYQRTEAVARRAAGETLASIARWLPRHRQKAPREAVGRGLNLAFLLPLAVAFPDNSRALA